VPRLIQTQPLALLSLLTSKDGGIGPSALADDVSGTIELLPFYGQQFRRHRLLTLSAAQLDGAGAAPGWWLSLLFGTGPGNLVVPEGQVWRILGLSATITTLNGTVQAQMGWSYKDPFSGLQAQPIPVGVGSGAIAAGLAGTSGGPCEIWAQPTACAAVLFRDFALGVNDCNLGLNVVYEVFEI
jgi:hypothetical protein